MRKLVSEREHLRGLRIRAVHEDQRRVGIVEREASKLGHAQPAMRVVPHDAVDHRHHADPLDRSAQLAHGLLPSADARSPSTIESERSPHLAPHGVRIIGKAGACHEGQWFRVALDEGLPQPLLSASHRVERVEQVGARPISDGIRHRAKVLNRETFFRGLGEKQVAERRMRDLGQLLQLLQRRQSLAPDPGPKLRHARRKVPHVVAGTFAGPAQHLGRHVYAGHCIVPATPPRPGPMQGCTEPSNGRLNRLSSVLSRAKHLMGILSYRRAQALSVRACSRRLLPTP